MRNHLILVIFITFPLAVSACSPSQPIPTSTAEPRAAFTPVPTNTPDFEHATSVDAIVGTWDHQGTDFYLRFYEDGTLHVARTIEELDSQPNAVNEVWFDGTQMVLKEILVSGVSSCGEVLGKYEVRLLANGNIWLVTIEDDCFGRARNTAVEFEPVR